MLTSFLPSIAIVSGLSLVGCATALPAPAIGHEAPKTSFALADGGEVRLDGARGDVVVLAFFTTYCPTSRATLRAVDDLRGRNAAAGLQVIAVDEGDSVAQVGAMTDLLKVRVSVAFDRDGVVAKELGLITVPSIVVIDRRGSVRHVHGGYHGEGDRSAVDREVAALLRETADAAAD